MSADAALAVLLDVCDTAPPEIPLPCWLGGGWGMPSQGAWARCWFRRKPKLTSVPLTTLEPCISVKDFCHASRVVACTGSVAQARTALHALHARTFSGKSGMVSAPWLLYVADTPALAARAACTAAQLVIATLRQSPLGSTSSSNVFVVYALLRLLVHPSVWTTLPAGVVLSVLRAAVVARVPAGYVFADSPALHAMYAAVADRTHGVGGHKANVASQWVFATPASDKDGLNVCATWLSVVGLFKRFRSALAAHPGRNDTGSVKLTELPAVWAWVAARIAAGKSATLGDATADGIIRTWRRPETVPDACPICYEDIVDHVNSGCIMLQHCDHVAHAGCMYEWAARGDTRSGRMSYTCPMCRTRQGGTDNAAEDETNFVNRGFIDIVTDGVLVIVGPPFATFGFSALR